MSGPTVVVTMAGAGQRFAAAGFDLPKPLIDVLGRPMYDWALEGVPLDWADRLVFVCLARHLDMYDLRRDIDDRFGAYDHDVVGIDDVTAGQACTVLAARDFIDPDAGLLVANADTWFRGTLTARLAELERRCDGVVCVFEAAGDHWSFARVDRSGRVVELAEKRRISRWATTGLYHFTRAESFLHHAEMMVREDDASLGEYYVAPVYNRLIAEGADIRIDIVDEVKGLGTPDELATFVRTPPAPSRRARYRQGPSGVGSGAALEEPASQALPHPLDEHIPFTG